MSTLPNPSAEQIFQMQYQVVRRDEVAGVLLAIFLGCFGIHHFYVGRNGLGILYLCLCWTGIPAILGLIECFFMPGRVRAYNAVQAIGLAAALGIPLPWYAAGYAGPGYAGQAYAGQGYAGPGYAGQSYTAPAYAPAYVSPMVAGVAPAEGEMTLVACGQCRTTNPVGARFCSACGSSLL